MADSSPGTTRTASGTQETLAGAGIAGDRRASLTAAARTISAFLDGDAEGPPGWLVSLVDPHHSPDVVATGGHVERRWPNLRPQWVPCEFDWVVGRSYLSMPDSAGAIRNLMGANMSMWTQAALVACESNAGAERIDSPPAGRAETELTCYTPDSALDHYVTPERVKFSYFMRPCWHEGLSKATVVQLAGTSAELQSKTRQVTLVILTRVVWELSRFLRRELSAPLRVSAAVGALTTAAAGFLTGIFTIRFVGVERVRST